MKNKNSKLKGLMRKYDYFNDYLHKKTNNI